MDAHASSGSGLTRRDVLKGGAAGLAAAGLPGRAWAQAPKRGGTLSLRLWDPPHWDPYLTISYKTHIAYSFTHSRLLRHVAVWDRALKNYGPNLGYDYGGRPLAAWLDR